MNKRAWLGGVLGAVLLLAPAAMAFPLPPGAAAPPAPAVPWGEVPALQGGAPWTIVVLLTALTLLPALLLAMTPFVRLLVIFHFLRQALGTQSIPTNQTLIGLALFLTWFLMAPVGTAVYQTSLVPLQNGSIDAITAVERGARPVRDFMLKYAREKDLALFVELAHEPRPRGPADLSMRVVVPAYMISELKAGFQIGAVLFIPFLVIDMAVASITTSVGMMQLPPVVISTPLKILVFVMADGWHLLVGSIMKSFY
jgi:flagellar biosynthetic protein FliP